MPTRILREGINDSRAVNLLSLRGEVFYRRLMSVVDDFGRFEADVELLRGELFKRQLADWTIELVAAALDEASATKSDDGQPLVVVYRVGHKNYLQISNFGQRVRSKSKYPSPEVPARFAVELIRAANEENPELVSNPPQSAAICGEPPQSAADVRNSPQPAAVGRNCPPTRARGRTESESESESYAESETKAESPVLNFPTRPNWLLDETFTPFVAAWKNVATVTGKPLLDEDFSNAHFRWGRMDFEQKLMAVRTTNERLEKGVWTENTDPQFVPLPAKYLELEYKRPVVAPKGRDSPRFENKTKTEAMLDKAAEMLRQEELRGEI